MGTKCLGIFPDRVFFASVGESEGELEVFQRQDVLVIERCGPGVVVSGKFEFGEWYFC